jgi:hypothetical protein
VFRRQVLAWAAGNSDLGGKRAGTVLSRVMYRLTHYFNRPSIKSLKPSKTKTLYSDVFKRSCIVPPRMTSSLLIYRHFGRGRRNNRTSNVPEDCIDVRKIFLQKYEIRVDLFDQSLILYDLFLFFGLENILKYEAL